MSLKDAREIVEAQGSGMLQDVVLERARDNGDNAVIATKRFPTVSSRHGPLGGIAFGVKDNIDVEGYVTTGGCPGLSGNDAVCDATPVAALRAAGGYVPVKLNLHELAFGITSNNAASGPVRNPFDLHRVAGGSSGGNGAAIARGVVPFALGTDTGGSTRIPAAFCSVAGFRPSTGRYPTGGVLTLSKTRDTIGPMAVDCIDLAEIDGIICGETALPPLPRRPLRLGVLWEKRGLSASVDQGIAKALKKLESSGDVDLTFVAVPEFEDLNDRMGDPIVFNEALAFWTTFCLRRGQSLSEFASTIASPDVRAVFESLPDLAAGTRDVFLQARESGLPLLRETYEALLRVRGFDAIIMPAVPIQPPLIGDDDHMPTDIGPKSTFATITSHTVLASLTGAPSVSIPAGLDRDGLPFAVMLEGHRNADRALLAMACRIEAHLAL